MTVVIFLSCTPHVGNSWKSGTSSDLQWPRATTVSCLSWCGISLIAHHLTSECPEDPGECHSMPLLFTEPFVGGSSFVFVKDKAPASICRLIQSLLSYLLPFFSSVLGTMALLLWKGTHKGCSCHLNFAGMFLPAMAGSLSPHQS